MLARAQLAGLVFALTATSALADTRRPLRGPAQWRPCGPGDTRTGNTCAPQTVKGIDMRPACEAHDTCYNKRPLNRKQCDQKFRDDVRALCDANGNPRGCHRRAQVLYLLVRVGGAEVFWRAAPQSP